MIAPVQGGGRCPPAPPGKAFTGVLPAVAAIHNADNYQPPEGPTNNRKPKPPVCTHAAQELSRNLAAHESRRVELPYQRLEQRTEVCAPLDTGDG